MKTLHCIISYNRRFYLENTVRSVQEHLPWGDVMVFDNGSDRAEVAEYLQRLSRSGVRVIARDRRFPGRYRGGLHEAMNEVVELATRERYDLVGFIQDDMQFLWRDDDLPARLRRVFDRHDDALQVTPLFQKKIMKYSLIEENRVEWHPESESYHLRPYGVADVGFFHLGRLRDAGFHFLNTEGENGRHWRDRGYKLYVLHASSLMYVPWPRDAVRKGVHGPAFPPPRPYYMRPLTEGQVQRLLSRSPTDLAFLDDYSRPWGWRCLWPYWYTQFMLRRDLLPYLRLLSGFWRYGEPIVPRLVGEP